MTTTCSNQEQQQKGYESEEGICGREISDEKEAASKSYRDDGRQLKKKFSKIS